MITLSAFVPTMGAGVAPAGTWTLDCAISNAWFGSIGNDHAGETHHFGAFDGTVGEDGTVTLTVDLTPAQTNIDTLPLLGTDADPDASFFVLRLRGDRVMVAANGMVTLSTEDAGIDADIDTLQDLAGLDRITRVSPVTLLRPVFDSDGRSLGNPAGHVPAGSSQLNR